MASKNHRLAIVNPDVQDNYLVSKDTVTVHPFSIDVSTCSAEKSLTVQFDSFCLVDDPTIVCKLELFYSDYNSYSQNYITSNFNLSFLTEVPPAYEYDISLYYVNRAKMIVHVSNLNVKNVRKNDKFVTPFKANSIPSLYYVNRVNTYAFCIKMSRKDILADFNQKPAFLLPTQITNCSLLFENSALTNFTIIVEEREFRVHKEILAARSPVFLSMFESEMKEKKENQVIIDDIEAEVFHEFLRYIYTNVVNDLNMHAEKLLLVAEKYDVPELKSVCSDQMYRSLTVENAVHALIVADRYSLKYLKDRAIGFIKNNIKSILDTEEFKTLYKSGQAYLLNVIVQILA